MEDFNGYLGSFIDGYEDVHGGFEWEENRRKGNIPTGAVPYNL